MGLLLRQYSHPMVLEVAIKTGALVKWKKRLGSII